jgi:hypothetical protein
MKKWNKKQLLVYINSNSSFIYVQTELCRFSCKMYINGNLLPFKATGFWGDLEVRSLNLLTKLLDNRFKRYVTYAYNKEHKLNNGNLWLFKGYL